MEHASAAYLRCNEQPSFFGTINSISNYSAELPAFKRKVGNLHVKFEMVMEESESEPHSSHKIHRERKSSMSLLIYMHVYVCACVCVYAYIHDISTHGEAEIESVMEQDDESIDVRHGPGMQKGHVFLRGT